ncbi:hypothetical protein ACQKLM_25695 [Bacillus thuringiensis]
MNKKLKKQKNKKNTKNVKKTKKDFQTEDFDQMGGICKISN